MRAPSPRPRASCGRGGWSRFPRRRSTASARTRWTRPRWFRFLRRRSGPRFNPLIVHVLGRADAEKHVAFNPIAQKLADAFWPGALTLVLPRREGSSLSLLASGRPRYGGAASAPSSYRARAAHRGRHSHRRAKRQSCGLGESDDGRSCGARSLQPRRPHPRCRTVSDRDRVDGDRFRERRAGSAAARCDHARGDRGALPAASPIPPRATSAPPA